MDKTPVIDLWAPIVPSREIVAHIRDHFPPAMYGYLRVFFKQEPDPSTFAKMAEAMVREDEAILKSLDEAGIDRALITGFDETSTAGTAFVSNEAVAAIAERHPTRFLPFAGVDILHGSEGVRELTHWVRDRGFRGLSLRPFMIGLPATDRRYYLPYAYRAWRRGRRATWIPAFPFEELLWLPLQTVRHIASLESIELTHPDGPIRGTWSHTGAAG